MTDLLKWAVPLQGHSFDLDDLVAAFTDNPRVEHLADEYVLRATALESAGPIPRAVFDAAEHVLAELNGAMHLLSSDYRLVEARMLVYRDDELGKRQTTFGFPGFAEERGRAFAFGVADGEAASPTRSRAAVVIDLAARDTHVADALRLLGRRETNWFDLYKLWEIVGKSSTIKARGWASRRQLRRFTGTANHERASGDDARHARSTTKPPRNPMSLDEGRDFISSIVQKWIDARVENAES